MLYCAHEFDWDLFYTCATLGPQETSVATLSDSPAQGQELGVSCNSFPSVGSVVSSR